MEANLSIQILFEPPHGEMGLRDKFGNLGRDKFGNLGIFVTSKKVITL